MSAPMRRAALIRLCWFGQTMSGFLPGGAISQSMTGKCRIDCSDHAQNAEFARPERRARNLPSSCQSAALSRVRHTRLIWINHPANRLGIVKAPRPSGVHRSRANARQHGVDVRAACRSRACHQRGETHGRHRAPEHRLGGSLNAFREKPKWKSSTSAYQSRWCWCC